MQIDNTYSGSYTHVPELGPQILAAVGEAVPMFADVKQITTDRNQYNQIYTRRSPVRHGPVKAAQRGGTTAPAPARVDITLYDLFSFVAVSNELLDSSNFDIAAYLTTEVTRQFEAAIEAEIVSGNGSNAALGILTQATSSATDSSSPERAFTLYQYVPTGAVSSPINTFTYNSLVDLVAALPVRYRRNAKFYASTPAVQRMRKLIGSDGQPIWKDASGGIATSVQSIMGYPVVEAPALQSVGSAKLPVVFGDLQQAYLWCSHSRGFRVIRDQITAPGQTKFYFSLQCGGKPGDTRAAKVLKISLT